MFHRRHRIPIASILLLLGALAAIWWGLGFAARDDGEDQKRKDAEEIASQTPNERGEVSPPRDLSEQEAAEIPRSYWISLVEEQPQSWLPEIEGPNGIMRFWFVNEREFYVEYRRSGTRIADRMAFLMNPPEIPDHALARNALYGQSEAGGWELIDGEDVLFTKPQKDLYERNAEGGWVKIN